MQICCTDSVYVPPFLVPAYDEDQEDSFFLVNLEKLSGSLAPFWNKRFKYNEVVF